MNRRERHPRFRGCGTNPCAVTEHNRDGNIPVAGLPWPSPRTCATTTSPAASASRTLGRMTSAARTIAMAAASRMTAILRSDLEDPNPIYGRGAIHDPRIRRSRLELLCRWYRHATQFESYTAVCKPDLIDEIDHRAEGVLVRSADRAFRIADHLVALYDGSIDTARSSCRRTMSVGSSSRIETTSACSDNIRVVLPVSYP